MPIDIGLEDLASAFPKDFSPEQRARAQTIFLKRLSILAHELYGGKMQTVPKCGLGGPAGSTSGTLRESPLSPRPSGTTTAAPSTSRTAPLGRANPWPHGAASAGADSSRVAK